MTSLGCTVSRTHDQPAAACAPELVEALEAAVRRRGIRPFRLPSGAGHDGQALSALCPVGMLFVRCKDRISHHPAESVRPEDAEAALGLGLLGLGAFLWALRNGQFEDLDGAAHRVLMDDDEAGPDNGPTRASAPDPFGRAAEAFARDAPCCG